MSEKIFGKVQALSARGMSFGTERTRKILDGLKSPDDKLKIIHIAGTNGKGSTAEFFTRILVCAGKRVGTFTSPAVYSYFDQFRINGEPIEKTALAACFSKAYEIGDSLGATQFEVETAGAILAFYECGCEYAVLECGMGGLTDATNAVNKKELAVITSVSLEHTRFLGSTVEEICRRKAGIIKNCPTLVNAYQYGEAKKYFESLGAAFCEPTEIEDGGFSYGGERYRINMSGMAQAYNAATSVAGARILGIGNEAIRKGLEEARLSGRCEVIEKDKIYILDGAHNPEAFAPLVQLLKSRGGNNTVIYGCLADKDAAGCIKILSGVSQNIIAVPTHGARAADTDKVFAECGKYFKNADCAKSVAAALDAAKTRTVAVCGSFTILEEAKRWISKRQ